MTEPKRIGFPELYDKLEAMDEKLNAHVVDMAVRVALLERESTRKWQVNMAQAGWLVSLIIAVGGWVVKA